MSKRTNNIFRFVPFGKTASSVVVDVENNDDSDNGSSSSSSNKDQTARLTISCDGLVPGSTLELTHWTGNQTPENLYADTSTEIALNFARARLDAQKQTLTSTNSYQEYDSAIVLNNHFDTDGVLSVFACLHPEDALANSELLIAGAEAGDFGEWSSDLGVKLDSVLCNVLDELNGEEERAYQQSLKALPSILADFQATGGEQYKDFWQDELRLAQQGWDAIQQGRVTMECFPNSRLAIVNEEEQLLSCHALHRGLQQQKLDGKNPETAATRVLRVRRSSKEGGGTQYQYIYEKPGHGWVSRLKNRKVVPDANGSTIAESLNLSFCSNGDSGGGGSAWAKAGGMTSICRTTRFVTTTPEQVATALLEIDSQGCSL